MFEILNGYLFLHKSLSIPGLGTIYMDSVPASLDSSTKLMLPPLHFFRFDKLTDAPDREFFAYLAKTKSIEDFEAIKTYTDFSFELRAQIAREGKVTWEGLGELKKDEEGNVTLESNLGNPTFLQPVSARKVIRPDAKHLLLVGDTERTTVEMNKWLHEETEQPQKKSKWWIYALVIGLLAIIVLLFHFSGRGWRPDSVGNQQLLHVDK